MGRSKRERRRRVAQLPDGIEWWTPAPGREAQGTITRVLTIRDEWQRDRHAVLVVRFDGYPGERALPDCVRARAIAQAVKVGTRVLIEYRGWQPSKAGRMFRDLRIHVGSVPEAT